jgi:hypothetical protein
MSRWGLISTLMVNIPPILLMMVGVAYQANKGKPYEGGKIINK